MQKSKILIILTIIMLLASCTNTAMQQSTSIEATKTKVATIEPTATIAPASPTPVPTIPKYIFIVIGDGFGQGHMMMGEIYARLVSEDMDAGASWEYFDQQHLGDGRGESAGGGTALATGYVPPAGYISTTKNNESLFTIMDRAKENGLSTGVVTNSTLMDATPATFLAHSNGRSQGLALVKGFYESNVDYIAGGGISVVVPDSYPEFFDKTDCIGDVPVLQGPETSFNAMLDMGYIPYLGLDGATQMLEEIKNNSFKPEKALCSYSKGVMPYEFYKMNPENAERNKYVPSLADMTNAGIQMLSQNPNGFVMMVEEAHIDKTNHSTNSDLSHGQNLTIPQLRNLMDTLDLIMDFYSEHPEETLVILTADHETGNYAFDEEKLNEFYTLPDFKWEDDSQSLVDFLNTSWDMSFNKKLLEENLNIAQSQTWNDLAKNRASLYTAITLTVSLNLGIKRRGIDHTYQPVPIYSTGKKSMEFADCTGIEDIPIVICEIMGWEALPELGELIN